MNSKENKYNLDTTQGYMFAWLNAFFVEHNFTNFIRRNFHKISDQAYRSSQPTMGQLETIVKKYGIKTVLNLKGENRNNGYFLLEERKCQDLGVALVSAKIFSRSFPDYNRLKDIKEKLESIEYPVLIHCKAGADRAGIVSTLYQHFIEKKPIEETDQLSFWPYGHVRYSKAGKSDFFFEEYVRYNRENPDKQLDLLTWNRDVFDREDAEKNFVMHPWADFIYDYILRRE
jgi:protein tyrosine/serine phosphatase